MARLPVKVLRLAGALQREKVARSEAVVVLKKEAGEEVAEVLGKTALHVPRKRLLKAILTLKSTKVVRVKEAIAKRDKAYKYSNDC